MEELGRLWHLRVPKLLGSQDFVLSADNHLM